MTADAIKALDLEQDFIVDVGVHEGTPWAYEAFPATPFVLIDPVDVPLKTRPKIIAKRYRCAVGADPSTGRVIGSKSMRQVVEGVGDVDILPLRALLEEHPGRFGLAINAEGWDADVIHGLGHRRDDVAWIMAEISLRENLFQRGRASDVFAAVGDDFQPRGVWPCPWPHKNYCAMLFLPTGDERLKR